MKGIENMVISDDFLYNLKNNTVEADFCYLCNNHPSSGHSDDCPLAKETVFRKTMEQLMADYRGRIVRVRPCKSGVYATVEIKDKKTLDK